MGEFKSDDNNRSSGSTKGPNEDLFDTLHPNKMMSNAQRVLSSAVNVLEEEIAAGILAAKKIEKKIIDVEDIREDPQDLMNRIRRDIHEAVDIFMDSVTAISRQLGALSDTISKKAHPVEKKQEPIKKTEVAIPVITNNQIVKPGDAAILQLSASNESSPNEVPIQFIKTDLTGTGNNRIISRNIRMEPRLLTLKPGEEKDISIHIKVPKTTAVGLYSGLFTDAHDPSNRAIIHLQITD